MFKWIVIICIFYICLGFLLAYMSSYTPISKQIDMKTMSLHKPQYILYTDSICEGNCKNYSSSSSWGGAGGGGK